MLPWPIVARRLGTWSSRSLHLQCFCALRLNGGIVHRYFNSSSERANDSIGKKPSGSRSVADPEMLNDVTIVNNEAEAAVALAKLLEVAADDPARMFACDTEVGKYCSIRGRVMSVCCLCAYFSILQTSLRHQVMSIDVKRESAVRNTWRVRVRVSVSVSVSVSVRVRVIRVSWW